MDSVDISSFVTNGEWDLIGNFIDLLLVYILTLNIGIYVKSLNIFEILLVVISKSRK